MLVPPLSGLAPPRLASHALLDPLERAAVPLGVPAPRRHPLLSLTPPSFLAWRSRRKVSALPGSPSAWAVRKRGSVLRVLAS